jgi:hypothetical protein
MYVQMFHDFMAITEAYFRTYFQSEMLYKHGPDSQWLPNYECMKFKKGLHIAEQFS